DLDDELGSDEHDMTLLSHRQLLQARGLPREHLVGQALERLTDHDGLAAGGIACAQVEVRQPTVPAPVSPLGGEHDEVEGSDGLDLAPRAAAASRVVAGIE